MTNQNDDMPVLNLRFAVLWVEDFNLSLAQLLSGKGRGLRTFETSIPVKDLHGLTSSVCTSESVIEALTLANADKQACLKKAIARVQELHEEIRYLRHYGNKDCTAMADAARERKELDTKCQEQPQS